MLVRILAGTVFCIVVTAIGWQALQASGYLGPITMTYAEVKALKWPNIYCESSRTGFSEYVETHHYRNGNKSIRGHVSRRMAHQTMEYEILVRDHELYAWSWETGKGIFFRFDASSKFQPDTQDIEKCQRWLRPDLTIFEVPKSIGFEKVDPVELGLRI